MVEETPQKPSIIKSASIASTVRVDKAGLAQRAADILEASAKNMRATDISVEEPGIVSFKLNYDDIAMRMEAGALAGRVKDLVRLAPGRVALTDVHEVGQGRTKGIRMYFDMDNMMRNMELQSFRLDGVQEGVEPVPVDEIKGLLPKIFYYDKDTHERVLDVGIIQRLIVTAALKYNNFGSIINKAVGEADQTELKAMLRAGVESAAHMYGMETEVHGNTIYATATIEGLMKRLEEVTQPIAGVINVHCEDDGVRLRFDCKHLVDIGAVKATELAKKHGGENVQFYHDEDTATLIINNHLLADPINALFDKVLVVPKPRIDVSASDLLGKLRGNEGPDLPSQ